MNDTTQQPSSSPASCCGPGGKAETPQDAGGVPKDVCSTMMAEMAGKCPCAAMMKRHPVAAIGLVLLFLAMFLISQIGGILGMIAFFRTL